MATFSTFTLLSFWILAFFTLTVAHVGNQTPCSSGNSCTVPAPRSRSLGNRVNDQFQGSVDVWASDSGNTFATNILVSRGQAWPRMSEGLTVPNALHPDFFNPRRSVQEYINSPRGRFITYRGQWVPRNFPSPGGPPSGGLQSGAYIWLNDRNNYASGTNNPLFPFTVEINIWNTHVGGPPSQAQPLGGSAGTYRDGSDTYAVAEWPNHSGGFRAFYFHHVNRNTRNMEINIKALLAHLVQYDRSLEGLEVITVEVAAEGINRADGKFIADIATMGT